MVENSSQKPVTRSERGVGLYLSPAVIILFLILGAALRIWLRFEPLGSLDSDEAVTGLMARHITEGELPTFVWGQAYGGSTEAFLTVPVFAVFGSGTLALKIVPALLYLIATWLVWRVGLETVGERAARGGAVLFWIAPAAFIYRSTEAYSFYNSGLVLGLGASLIILRLRRRVSKDELLLLGFLLGAGWWTNPQIVPLIVPALLWLAFRNPSVLRSAWLLIPGVMIGALPWLINNVANDWHSLRLESGPFEDNSYPSRLLGFFTGALPITLGLKVPLTQEWVMPEAAALLLLAAALAGAAFLSVRRPGGTEPLMMVAVAYPLLYAISSFTAYVADGRYLYLLWPVLALLMGYALARWRLEVIGLSLVLALSVSGLAWANGARQRKVGESNTHPPTDLGPFLGVLEDRGVDRVFTDYWIAYRMTFESDESVIATPMGNVRYPPHDRLVRASPNPAYVFVTESDVVPVFEQALTARQVGYERIDAAGLTLFLPAAKLLPEIIPEIKATVN